jgi:hypothetical protein
MVADTPRPEDTPKFRSPKRSLALAFRLSRDRWKAKATCRLREIKTLRVRVRDLLVSRDLWKAKALYLQEQLQQPDGSIPVPALPPPPAADGTRTGSAADAVAQPAALLPTTPAADPGPAVLPTAAAADPGPAASYHTVDDAPKKKRRRARR